MHKLSIVVISALFASCTTARHFSQTYDNAVYMIEEKTKLTEGDHKKYYIKVSLVDNPVEIHSKNVGMHTWKSLHPGDILDADYRLVK